MDLSDIIDILAEPISLEPVKPEYNSSGSIAGVIAGQTKYAANHGVLNLRPANSSIVHVVGSDSFSAWKELQQTEDASRSNSETPAEVQEHVRRYGEVLAALESGLYLDIGCGTDSKPAYMQIANDHSYVGLDLTTARAERSFPVVQGLGDFLPFQNESFDGVMFSSSLDETINPYRTLQEAVRILKPSGYCVIFQSVSVPGVVYQRWSERARYSVSQFDKRRHWAISEEDVFDFARRLGLDIVNICTTPDSNETIFVLQKPFHSSVVRRLYGDNAQSEKIEALSHDWSTFEFPESLPAASKYARGMHAYPFEFFRKRILQLNLGGGKIFDAGGGTGTWSFAMAPDFDSVLCIDKSDDRIKIAKELQQNYGVGNVDFVCGDLMESGLSDNAIDVVFCYRVVISYLEFEDVFSEFHRILKPGGCIYACVNGLGWLRHLIDHSGGNESRATIAYRGIYNFICRQNRDTIVDGLRNFNTILADTTTRNQLADEVGVPQSVLIDFFKSLRKIRGEDDANAHAIINLLRESNLAAAHDEISRTIVINCDRWGKFQGQLIKTFDDISEYCVTAFEWAFLRDISLILIGKTDEFSHAKAGRIYEPQSIERTLKTIGYSGFEWDVEGGLDRRPTNKPLFAKERPMYDGRYNGNLGVWEFVATKNG